MPKISSLVVVLLSSVAFVNATIFEDHVHRRPRAFGVIPRRGHVGRTLGGGHFASGPKRRLVSRATTQLFAPTDYATVQISDGVAGNALAEAQQVCTLPFANVDLSTVSESDLNNLEALREAAETAEGAQFDPEIAAASGAQATALQNGKIKNKVFKLACFLQVLQIKQAQGSDQTAAIANDQGLLNTNVALDKAAAGQPSEGVTGGAASNAAVVASTTTTNAAASVSTSSAQAADAVLATSSTGVLFAPLSYADGQISDGVAGNAQEQANAVCVLPFANVNLADVSASDLANLQAFRELAENAETDEFDPEIAAATGAAATALQNGKIKNKVLKLTCEIQGLQIEAAQGKDETSDIATEQTKLNTNIAQDKAAAGQPSQGVA